MLNIVLLMVLLLALEYSMLWLSDFDMRIGSIVVAIHDVVVIRYLI